MKLFETDFSRYDLNDIINVFNSGALGFGENVTKFEEAFGEFNSSYKYHSSTNSASASAYMIFSYLYEKYGSCDVYTTSLGFASPVWAAKQNNHNVIWVDVDDNLLFDCDDYIRRSTLPEWRIETGRKKVIMPVLYGGVDSIPNWKIHGNEIIVIDAAHNPKTSMLGDFMFTSFHPFKPIASSDGGMISTNDQSATEFFKKFRNFGRSPLGNSYDIDHNGFKFYMNNLNATIALESMKHYDILLAERKERFKQLSKEISMIPHDDNSSYYIGTALVDNANEIISRTGWGRHYPMLHKTSYWDNGFTHLPNLEKIHHKILNIPLHAKIDKNICDC